MAPTFAISLFFVYGYILWTAYFSVSASRMMPNYTFVGLENYIRLWSTPRWFVAVENIFIFGPLFVLFSTVIGLLLAILLDQRIRAEGVLRTVYLYPMAISFIVTGTAWKWILDPGLGIPKLMHDLGWTSFRFDWIVQPDYAIYCLVVAAVWQSSGFVMATFLAALRGVNDEVINAARLDGASLMTIYFKIIIPIVRPAFITVIVLLTHLAIKSFDLVIALTNGGPGYSTELPSTFMYSSTFSRNQIGVGAASAIMMLATMAAIMVPYLYSELRGDKRDA
ncbi:carbohydrate ABC transporter permease [Rhizobium sp. S152]|uniref:carbohydrate ABC transporter permease n=1 Tax=Rhizobium sp. S152 TaxID=3055038 RepID=UPI00301429CF